MSKTIVADLVDGPTKPQADDKSATGYSHALYAASFSEWGVPHPLPNAGGWVIEREIAGLDCRDAMGAYPFCSLADWDCLPKDLEAAAASWVSLTLVTDPFADVTESVLRQCFPAVMRPYKEHYVVELGRPPADFVHAHHLRNAVRARQGVEIRRGPPTPRLLREWTFLYDHLIRRHGIRGLTAFSAASFDCQFRVPGLVVQWAESEEQILGMVLWYISGDRAYYHLGAYSEAGYAAKVSFALFLSAIEDFTADGLRWLVLGAGAGAANDGTDGLTRFKRGWATGTRPTYLCGRIFDLARYQAICQASGVADSAYFPAYRAGEFG